MSQDVLAGDVGEEELVKDHGAEVLRGEVFSHGDQRSHQGVEERVLEGSARGRHESEEDFFEYNYYRITNRDILNLIRFYKSTIKTKSSWTSVM